MAISDYQRPPRPADLEATISFLSSAEGGRSSPARSGYRPSHDFGLSELSDAQHEYLGRELVHPGESARALLWLLVPESQAGRLGPGFEFKVQEGAHVVGRGRITAVLNATLERGA